AGGVGGDELGLNLIQRHRRGVYGAHVGRTERQQVGGHDRAGIKANRTASEQITPTHRDKVDRAGAGADKVHGHVGSVAASAQVAGPTAIRAASRRADGPAAASAAASATEGTPLSAITRSECVSAEAPAARNSCCGISIKRTPSAVAA